MQEAYCPPRSHSNFLLFQGGGPFKKIFFPVWTCIKPNLVSKIFPFTGEGGVPQQKNFSQSEQVSSQIWCQGFSLYWGEGALDKNFFPSLNMYEATSGVKNFSLYWGGGPLNKNFFSQSEHVSSQIWCQQCFPLLRGGPSTKIFFPVWTCIKPNLVSKIFPFTETGYPPTLSAQKSETWDPPIQGLIRYPPLRKSETWDPPLSKAG